MSRVARTNTTNKQRARKNFNTEMNEATTEEAKKEVSN